MIGDVDDPAAARRLLRDLDVLFDPFDLAEDRIERVFQRAIDRIPLRRPQLVEVGVDPLPRLELGLPVAAAQVPGDFFPCEYRLRDVVEHHARTISEATLGHKAVQARGLHACVSSLAECLLVTLHFAADRLGELRRRGGAAEIAGPHVARPRARASAPRGCGRGRSSSPMWSQHHHADSSSAVGLARFLPAMSGALPCTASKTADLVPCSPPARRRGRRPGPRTDRTRCRRTGSPAAARRTAPGSSRAACSRRRRSARRTVMSVYSRETFARALEEQPVAELHDVRLVDGGDPLAAVRARVLEGELRDARGGLLGDDLQALDDARHDLVLEAGVQVLGVLADDDHVDVVEPALDARQVAHRAQVRVEVERLAQPTLTLVNPLPIGVVTGPLRATLFRRIESSSVGGSDWSYRLNAVTPASCRSHSMSTPAAFKMRTTAAVTSGPMPSPGISVIVWSFEWF